MHFKSDSNRETNLCWELYAPQVTDGLGPLLKPTGTSDAFEVCTTGSVKDELRPVISENATSMQSSGVGSRDVTGAWMSRLLTLRQFLSKDDRCHRVRGCFGPWPPGSRRTRWDSSGWVIR